jgi:hypothetical protein
MANVVDRTSVKQFRKSIEDLLKEAQTLSSSVKPCAAVVDPINQLVARRNQVELVMGRIDPNADKEGFARQQEQFDSLTREIGELCDPFPRVEKERGRFVRELETVLNATPVTPATLLEIRKEMERLPLLQDPEVGMEQCEADLVTLQQRLTEMLVCLPGGSKQHMAEFPTPQGAAWEDVRIRFLSDHRIAVDVLGVSVVFNFAEAGFEDRRTSNPNTNWILLGQIARRNGQLERPRGRREDVRKVEKGVQGLRDLFRIPEDPFLPYRKVGCYQARFKISFPHPDIR